MPRNATPRGIRQPSHVLTNTGVWVRNKFAGLRTGKNTNITDIKHLKAHKVTRKTHTSPVVRTKLNDGHNSPPLMRAAKTKAYHSVKNKC